MSLCITPTSCVAQVADSLWTQLATSLSDAAGDMVTTLFGWWTTSPSLDVNQAVVHNAQQYVTAWIAVPVAVLAVLAAVGWGVLSGSVAWIGDVARGLLVFGIVTAGSLPIVSAMQTWSTGLAKGLLAATPSGDVGRRVVELTHLPGSQAPTIAFWAVIVLVVSAVQYLLMLFRDGAVLVLTAVLPIAAAGQFNRGTVLWLPKVVGWLLALVFVKPAAALIYFLGLSLIGEGQGVQALATAVCLMMAAIFALPAMLRLVTFAVTAAPMGSSALGTAATVTGVGASLAQTSAVRRSAGAAPSGAAPAGGTSSATRASTAASGGAAGAAAASGPAAVGVAAASAATKLPDQALKGGGNP